MKLAPIPLGSLGGLSMEFDEESHRALVVADAVATGNPTGCGRKISSRFGVPCSIMPLPNSTLARFELSLEITGNDLNRFLANPRAYLQEIHRDVSDIIRLMDRFSL